jgi:hypothetical protein
MIKYFTVSEEEAHFVLNVLTDDTFQSCKYDISHVQSIGLLLSFKYLSFIKYVAATYTNYFQSVFPSFKVLKERNV